MLQPEELLRPDVIDGLPLVGVGTTAQVRRYGPWAVKVAHPGAAQRRWLAEEIEILAELQDRRHRIPAPRLLLARGDLGAYVRAFLPHPCLLDLLQRRGRAPGGRLLDALWQLSLAVDDFRARTGVRLDLSPSNLYWDARRARLWLADPGRRRDRILLRRLQRDQVAARLQDYLRWRTEQAARRRVRPLLLPPSGRFHVDVGLGPVPEARVLWRNDRLLRRLGLPWDARQLLGYGGIATHAAEHTVQLPATRYQDAPGRGPEDAQGDGRVVFVGEVETAIGEREVTLKGCGPTPLAWTAVAYHHDGLVSFNRTLWEASVCDELARLGFDTPQVLAVFSTGKTTVDNTDRPWPAAAALRACRTHLRLGHLKRYEDDPPALRDLCQHVGRRLLRPDFDPGRRRDLRALVLGFAASLGHDTGRSQALGILCFNPTIGNLRLDGHFIDFSTVRFFRHCVPDFRYMNFTRPVRQHRAALRRYPGELVSILERGGLLGAAGAAALLRRARRAFDDGYEDGYLDGLGALVGYAPGQLAARSRRLRRRLVFDTLHLRDLRADAQLVFRFWDQTVPAPLFDLEGQLPSFIEAWSQARRHSWRALCSRWLERLTPAALAALRGWLDTMAALFPFAARQELRPRRWDQVVRPFMEAEALAELCYQRSRPDDCREWARCIAGGWNAA